MAYESVKNQIDAYIKANGVNLITGPVLNAVLTTMLDELGEGYAFQGVLNTTDTPSPAADIPQAWLASAGTYLGGSITVDEGELALIIHTSDGWSKETVYRGVQLSYEAIVAALEYTPAPEYRVDSLEAYVVENYQPKLESGENIKTINGESILGEGNIEIENIDTVRVTVDNNTGTPSATGSVSGSILSLDFHNLKGAQGPKGDTGATGPQGPQGPQGEQGNPGSSVDYPFELANNLTTDDPRMALSAAQGVVLEGEISRIGQKVDPTTEHSKNLADFAEVIAGFIDSNGNFNVGSGQKSILFPCDPSTTYTISKILTSRFRVAYFSDRPQQGSSGAGVITNNLATALTITTASTSSYIVAYVYNGPSESVTVDQIVASLQIEVGSTATEYAAPGWSAVDKVARENNTTIERRIETIEESVSNNSEDISELQNAVLHSVSGVDSTLVNTGKYRVITGALADFNAFFYTDPIHLYKGDKIVITSADIAASCSAISLLDANGDYVSTIYAGQGETASYTYTAQEDVLVELSALISQVGCFAIDRNGILNRLSLDEGRIEVLENTIQDKTFGLDGVQVTTGAYRNSDGTISSLNGYYYTEPIKLHKGDSLFTDISIPTSSVVAYVTEVDSLGNFVSVLKAGSGEDETISVTIEKDCFVSISSVNSNRGNFFFTRNGLSTRMDILSEGGTEDTIDPATKLPAIGENPLSSIRRDAGYGAIIRKWGIIGDSLSSGEMQCYNDESTSSSDYKFIDMYKYSTGQVFARLIGAEAYNFSNGGQTTWGWLKSQGVVRDETYIGGVGGGDWRLAQQPEYIKDGYIIAMGVNDRAKIAKGDYELGTTSQITPYNGTNSDIDDTTTYQKSFVRYYAGIIQRLLSVQPKAKIFCVTPLGDDYAEIAQAIRDIVTYFGGNVYLMDIREYIPDGYNVTGFKLQGHLSPMGYAYWAYMFNTYIDWIIRNNGNAFRDTALIGTGYRPDYS